MNRERATVKAEVYSLQIEHVARWNRLVADVAKPVRFRGKWPTGAAYVSAVEEAWPIRYNVRMVELHRQSPSLPRQPLARPTTLTGCVVACGFALLPIILYVGSFVYILADEHYGWGLVNERTIRVIFVVYEPLFWVYKEVLTIAGY